MGISFYNTPFDSNNSFIATLMGMAKSNQQFIEITWKNGCILCRTRTATDRHHL